MSWYILSSTAPVCSRSRALVPELALARVAGAGGRAVLLALFMVIVLWLVILVWKVFAG